MCSKNIMRFFRILPYDMPLPEINVINDFHFDRRVISQVQILPFHIECCDMPLLRFQNNLLNIPGINLKYHLAVQIPKDTQSKIKSINNFFSYTIPYRSCF